VTPAVPSAVPPGPGAFDAVAWSWVQHLRRGGTHAWLEWAAAEPAASTGAEPRPGAGRLPGAAQLEVVRRLAARPTAATVPFEQLADLVLGRGAPGRGPDDLPLVWPAGDQPTGFGPPPVDPAGLPAAELVRVLVGVITELLVRTAPRPAGRPGGSGPRGNPARADGFPVVGAPAPAAAVRAALAAAGHRPADPPTAAVLLAEPVDRLLAQAWTRRVRRGGIVPWPRYVDRWVRQDRLPAAVDLATVAARWATQVGVDRVHVVVVGPGPDAIAAVRTTAAHVLGLSLAESPGRGPLEPAQVELVRLVNQVLRGRVAAERHRQLLRRLMPRLAEGPAGARLPVRNADWVDTMSARVREELRAGGYPLHGDLDMLRPAPADPSAGPELGLLPVALDTCLALAADPAASVVLSAATSGAGR